jgi:hypothetical protein
MNYFSYWSGDMPHAVALCLDSIRKHYPLRVLEDADVPKRILQIPHPARSDHLRLWLLSKYGGVYFDSDVVVNEPFDFEKLRAGYELTGFKAGMGWGLSNIVMTARNGALLDRIYEDSQKYEAHIPAKFLRNWWLAFRVLIRRYDHGLYSPKPKITGWLLDDEVPEPVPNLVHLTGRVVKAIQKDHIDDTLHGPTAAAQLLERALC